MNIFLGRLAIFIVIFGTWQLSSGPLIDPFFVSSPSEIAGKSTSWSSVAGCFLMAG